MHIKHHQTIEIKYQRLYNSLTVEEGLDRHIFCEYDPGISHVMYVVFTKIERILFLRAHLHIVTQIDTKSLIAQFLKLAFKFDIKHLEMSRLIVFLVSLRLEA